MADIVIFGTGRMAQMTKVYIDRHESGIAGGATIGEQCFIGAHVGIGPDVTIEARCALLNGAGTDRDLPDETVVLGAAERLDRDRRTAPSQ